MDTTRQTNDQDLVRTLVAQIFDRVMAVQHLQQPIDLTSSPFKEPALKKRKKDPAHIAHLVRSSRQSFTRMLALRNLRSCVRGAQLLEQQLAGSLGMMQGEGHNLVQSAAATSSVYNVGAATNIKFHEGMVPRDVKEKLMDQKGVVIWFTGLSGSGKSTVACTLEHALAERGKVTILLDGDNVRHGLNSNLGFTANDREENIRRIGEVSKLFAESGVLTLTSFISPYKTDREKVRARMADGDFIEVFMRIPIEVCEQRDPKGLYKAARAGKIKNFTGIDDPYEEPDNAEIVIDAKDANGKMASAESMAGIIVEYLEKKGYLKAPKA